VTGIVKKRVSDLHLDGTNPRHDPVSGEREAIEALLAKEGAKITALAYHIATKGLSPIDLPLVVEEPAGVFVVVEGNRRLAALKLLADPSLTARADYAKRFGLLKKKMTSPIFEVSCYVVATRDDAKPWQEIRHSGEQDGRGVVRWDAEATARFFGIGKTGKHVADAITLIDELRKVYPKNAALQTDLDTIRGKRLTTLGRILGDPDVRDRFGLVLKPTVVSHYTSADLEALFSRMAADVASGTITVSAVFKKKDRTDYLTNIGAVLPDPARRKARATALAPITKSAPAPAPVATAPTPAPMPTAPTPALAPAPTTARPAPQRLFEGVTLNKLGGRIPGVLDELLRLDPDRFPNASAALMRLVLELAVLTVFDKNTWPKTTATTGKNPRDLSLAEMVRECLGKLDPGGKDLRYQPIRVGLSDPNSIVAVRTLNAWLHNPYFRPTDLRAIAANYSPFLSGLEGLVP